MELKETEVMTVEEAEKKYPRQWLGVEVVSRDEQSGQPLKVRVLSASVDLYTVRSNIGLDGGCTIYTGPIPEIKHVAMF